VGTAIKLTRRAQEVVELIALGLTNREIAQRLFVSERTVEWHIEQIFNKLGFTSRSQVAAWVGRFQIDAAVPVPSRRPRGNLPAQLTTFVGRNRELSSLFDLVTANRLVTVTGAGGTGKTRLALRMAEELQPDIPQGVWLCDLASVAEASLVGDAVARALGANRAAPDRLAAARDLLRERSLLLVLDNCEHLLPASGAVALDLLAACPGVRIVATSRTPLGVIGESVFALQPLAPDDAIELFRHRAEAASPVFRLDATNANAVATICRRLDRIPLAIELVVPRLRVQSAEQLAAAVLDPAWQVRSDERHGSLRSLADWSYQLLKPDEQALFRRLGVFAGWFDAEDAAAIEPPAGTPTPVLLGALVEHSMLVQEQTPTGGRYRLLETLRAFALEKLEDAGGLESARLSHVDRIVWLVERVDMVPRQGPALRAKTIAMIDDVRAALATLLEVDPRRAAWLCAAMTTTWMWSGRALEGLRWSDQALAVNPAPSRERCWHLFEHARMLASIGRDEEARTWLAKAEALAALPEHAALQIRFSLSRALVHGMLGDPLSAFRAQEEAIQASGREGNEWILSRALNHSAMSLVSLGRAAEAKERAQRSIEIYRRVDPSRVLYVLDTLAMAHTLLGERDEARQCWLLSWEQCRDMGWGWEENPYQAVFGLALVAGLRGKKEVALRLHYFAERLMAEVSGAYDDPISPKEAEVMALLEADAGPEAAIRLRAESEALTPEMAIRLAESEG
jgi:predicted ATPase/DNA-binding CsgD family transcriptional regulator/predicted HTH domain antitoxin